MKLADFFIGLGIKGDVKTKEALSGIHGVLSNAKNTSLEFKAGLLGAIVGLEEMTRTAVTSAGALKDFAGDTGYSIEMLQKWQYWAVQNRLSADDMAEGLKNLQMIQAGTDLGVSVRQAMGYFGISAHEDKFKMLEELQAKMHKIFQGGNLAEIGKARYMVEQLGLGKMFAAFTTGTQGFGGYTENMGMHKGEMNELIKLGQEWSKFWLTITGSKNKLVANEFSGPITDLVHTMTNAVNEFVELSKKFNKSLEAFSPKHAAGIKEGLLAILGSIAIFSSTGPFAPLILSVVALGAALDQIYKYTHGEKSVLGMLSNTTPNGWGAMSPDAQREFYKRSLLGSAGAAANGVSSLYKKSGLSLGLPTMDSAGGDFLKYLAQTLSDVRLQNSGKSVTVHQHVVHNITGSNADEIAAKVKSISTDDILNALYQDKTVNSYIAPAGSGQ